MRRKLCCLAALFVLILCNEVRLIIVDRAIKLRCWFARLSTPGCDMQGASAQVTASALLFTSVSTTAGNTSVEYTSCSLEKSFAVTGEPLNQTALKTTSGARVVHKNQAELITRAFCRNIVVSWLPSCSRSTVVWSDDSSRFGLRNRQLWLSDVTKGQICAAV